MKCERIDDEKNAKLFAVIDLSVYYLYVFKLTGLLKAINNRRIAGSGRTDFSYILRKNGNREILWSGLFIDFPPNPACFCSCLRFYWQRHQKSLCICLVLYLGSLLYSLYLLLSVGCIISTLRLDPNVMMGDCWWHQYWCTDSHKWPVNRLGMKKVLKRLTGLKQGIDQRDSDIAMFMLHEEKYGEFKE